MNRGIKKSDQDFESSTDIGDVVRHVSQIVNKKTGIQLGEKQFGMVESRMLRRMMELGIESPDQYINYLEEHIEEESEELTSLLTTHHTYFFREYLHFEYLEQTALPKLVSQVRSEKRNKIKIWSAACSRGQEVYSLAIFVDSYLKKAAPDISFEIYGTDVDPQSVSFASNGVYRWEEIKEIPRPFLEGYWKRGTGEISDFVQISPKIKSQCHFGLGNLVDLPLSSTEKYDVIFCRNVYIYFNAEQIKKITEMLLKRLEPEGLLFLGLSESLAGLNLDLESDAPSIYRRKKAFVPQATTPAPSKSPVASVIPMPARPIRVLCVDDSPTILALMKKILTSEHGFEIVTTAVNGKDAAEKLRQHSVDVMTLDIHMPEMTGDQYLAKHFSPTHPPVVVVSSVSRENKEQGIRCLELGAVDYIEKPSLTTLEARAEEIRTKLKFSVRAHGSGTAGPRVTLEQAVSMPVNFHPDAVRVISGSLASRKRILSLLETAGSPQPCTLLLIEKPLELLETLCPKAQKGWSEVKVLTSASEKISVRANTLLIGALENSSQWISELKKMPVLSLMLLGDLSSQSVKLFQGKWPQSLVEDTGNNSGQFASVVSDYSVPLTSFFHHSDEFLRKTR